MNEQTKRIVRQDTPRMVSMADRWSRHGRELWGGRRSVSEEEGMEEELASRRSELRMALEAATHKVLQLGREGAAGELAGRLLTESEHIPQRMQPSSMRQHTHTHTHTTRTRHTTHDTHAHVHDTEKTVEYNANRAKERSRSTCTYSMGRAPVARRMAMRPTAQMWVRLTSALPEMPAGTISGER
jgi:hypothetical protein